MIKKSLGICLSLLLFVLLLVQIGQVSAQEGNDPITGPITEPITSAIESPTPSTSSGPTPTLIDTVSTTPTPTVTGTPTDSITPSATPSTSPTVTTSPTPTSIFGAKLGGINLEGYCLSLNMPWDVVVNGSWYCANGASPIDLTAACQWQYSTTDVIAVQEIASDPYGWVCDSTSGVTPTPTQTPSLTPTPSLSAESPTPTDLAGSPSPTDIPTTATPTQATHHDNDRDRDDFRAKFQSFFVNAAHFFKKEHHKRGDADDLNTHSCRRGDHNTHETYYHSPRK